MLGCFVFDLIFYFHLFSLNIFYFFSLSNPIGSFPYGFQLRILMGFLSVTTSGYLCLYLFFCAFSWASFLLSVLFYSNVLVFV